ncbi:MAG: PH domain-containing protein [Candidatus Bathyarchaeia archaeon]
MSAFFGGLDVHILLPFLFIASFRAYWIPKYRSSMVYQFKEDKILVERGVWWKQKKAVPYNRITNIDVTQVPTSRRYDLVKVSVQTSGYRGTSGSTGAEEVAILGVKRFDEIRKFILEQVKPDSSLLKRGVENPVSQIPKNELLMETKRVTRKTKSELKILII